MEEEEDAGGGEMKLSVAIRSLAYLQGYRCGRLAQPRLVIHPCTPAQTRTRRCMKSKAGLYMKS